VTQVANEYGKPVEGDTTEYLTCNEQDCADESVDCEFSAWSEYSDCSATCNGVMDRSRRIKTNSDKGGLPCEGNLKEVEACNVGLCDPGVPVACTFTDWGYWSACS